jgi:DNA-binding FadR family transcriptional regulator
MHSLSAHPEPPRRGIEVKYSYDRDPRAHLGRHLVFGLLDVLGQSIVGGEYDTHPFPTEQRLSNQYSISRSVTREAVKMLCAKGLVSARPRQGTVIEPTSSWNVFDADVLRWMLKRGFSMELLRHFNHLRMVIEPAAAALAAEHTSPVHLAAISDAVSRIEAAEATQDDLLAACITFHVAVLQATDNPFYVQFRDFVNAGLRTCVQHKLFSQRRAAGTADYVAVRNAIAGQNAERARSAMQHIMKMRPS